MIGTVVSDNLPAHSDEVKRRLQQLNFRPKERIDTENLKP